MNTPHIHPPVYVIDEDVCKFHDCSKCVEVCPTDAIDLDEEPEERTLNVGAIIV
ncbi:MAG: heterodisulfide reductase subunit A, partial [Desulfobacterales bacterium]|nr:heterodisulfide reductase subunit A [Desulfobacterales bacterium]